MTTLMVAGGVYHELSVWPEWNQVFGSGGRAAAAAQGHVPSVELHCYAQGDASDRIRALGKQFGFTPHVTKAQQTISFSYIHSLAVPAIRPTPTLIQSHDAISIAAEVVLRFGMMEGSARVEAEYCVYDPQSALDARPFDENGSMAKHLAVVGNRSEIEALGGERDALAAARKLLANGAEAVVVKSGTVGAYVIDANGQTLVPAFQTERVWKVGSGDVFAAIFACYWGVHRLSAQEAAEIASRAVAEYVESMALPPPSAKVLRARARAEAKLVPGKIYLAGPFFTMGQRWLIDETREALLGMGLQVFSPVHDVGSGPAEVVAPADLAGLDECDAVLAVLDGNDPGTVFEVGYARAKNLPIYALAQTVSDEDMKMVAGSGCRVFDDFVTTVHHVAWRS